VPVCGRRCTSGAGRTFRQGNGPDDKAEQGGDLKTVGNEKCFPQWFNRAKGRGTGYRAALVRHVAMVQLQRILVRTGATVLCLMMVHHRVIDGRAFTCVMHSGVGRCRSGHCRGVQSTRHDARENEHHHQKHVPSTGKMANGLLHRLHSCPIVRPLTSKDAFNFSSDPVSLSCGESRQCPRPSTRWKVNPPVTLFSRSSGTVPRATAAV
jgi:hypothetical protein